MSSTVQKLGPLLKEIFTLDLRSLALLRIGVGLVVLLDLIYRAGDISAFYTDSGVLPRSSDFLTQSWSFTFHTLSGSFYAQVILFLLHAIIGLLLVVGLKTRFVTFLCWFFSFSLINRNLAVTSGADALLLYLLLIGIFLPWGKRFSIDSLFSNSSEKTYFGASTIAYLAHIFMLYFFNGAFKINSSWLLGDALFNSLAYLPYQQPPGLLLLRLAPLVSFLNYTVILFELSIPILIIFSFKNWLFRLIVLGAIAGFHLGIGISMELGLFSLIAIVGLLGLLPERLWDYLEKLFPKSAKSETVQSRSLYLMPKIPFFRFGSLNFNKLEILIVFLVLYTFLLNIIYLSELDSKIPAEKIIIPARLFDLPIKWDLYANTSPVSNWLYVIGQTKDGSKIDYFSEQKQYNLNEPSYDTTLYKNHRWKKYSYLLLRSSKEDFAQYICRTQKKNNPSNEFVSVKFFAAGQKYNKEFGYSPVPVKLIYNGECVYDSI